MRSKVLSKAKKVLIKTEMYDKLFLIDIRIEVMGMNHHSDLHLIINQ